MKNSYSHPVLRLKKIAKKHHLTIIDTHKKLLRTIELSVKNEYESLIQMLHTDIEFEICNGKHTNIFIPSSGLFDFLINNKIKTDQTLKELIDSFCLTKEQYGPNKRLLFVIHHKKNGLNSIIYNLFFFESGIVITYMSKGDDTPIFVNKKISDSVNSFLTGSQTYYGDRNTLDDNKLSTNLLTNLLFNIMYYSMVFPDKIIDGVPVDFKNVDMLYYIKKDQSFVFEPHEKIIDRSGVTPHFRRGHFAKLESERYVNMRGHIIWISEAMVKGFQAKTVIE